MYANEVLTEYHLTPPWLGAGNSARPRRRLGRERREAREEQVAGRSCSTFGGRPLAKMKTSAERWWRSNRWYPSSLSAGPGEKAR